MEDNHNEYNRDLFVIMSLSQIIIFFIILLILLILNK